jgi:hypothetical protein
MEIEVCIEKSRYLVAGTVVKNKFPRRNGGTLTIACHMKILKKYF